MVNEDTTIELKKDLSHNNYQKLVEFLGGIRYCNKRLLRIVKAEAEGNPPIYKNIVIGFYGTFMPAKDEKKVREGTKKVLKALVDTISESEFF